MASLKGPCRGLYYSSCMSTIYVDHLINCDFTYLPMILILYMLMSLSPSTKDLHKISWHIDWLIQILHGNTIFPTKHQKQVKPPMFLQDEDILNYLVHCWRFIDLWFPGHYYMTLHSEARANRYTLVKSLFYKSMPFVLSSLHLQVKDLLPSLFLFPLIASQSASFIWKKCRF